ncbi:hypothetical protein F5Y19DRAFT_261759 [Xylariaceae sp. FL1651]|nr:hypothetical protein F5Y19DRAFT_261759 [Xylariaceae sp. FL1651]
MEFDAHQMSLGPFGGWVCHTRHPQDIEVATRALHPHVTVSASSSPLPRCISTIQISKCSGGMSKSIAGRSHAVTGSVDAKRGSKLLPSSPKPQVQSQQEAKHAFQATRFGAIQHRKEIEERTAVVPNELLVKHNLFVSPDPDTLTLALRPAKRTRPLHDVDGPGTDKLPCKKRRLLLHLVTSRLSQPFSLPATHILIRESSDNMPVLHRIQQLASLGARRVGHQSSLVRKAAILNRVRIGVRQAAVSRGHTIMADLAARGNALNHGLQLVTMPSSGSMGARYPGTSMEMAANVTPARNTSATKPIPPVRRLHTTSCHSPIAHGSDTDTRPRTPPTPDQESGVYHSVSAAHVCGHTRMQRETFKESARVPSTVPRYVPPVPVTTSKPASHTYADISDEEDNTAFPASNFRDRYADLSDDDMDDVYADFGVLFGSGARSPEARTVGSPAEEQFYEEYLDELDGIPWVA